MGYGVNLPSGSGSIEKSLSFVTSQKMDNVENYIVCTGCITNEITIEIANDSPVNVTQSFRAKNISTPATTPGFTGTPTYAANTTLLPWTNQTPGSGPLTFNGTVVDVSTFSTTITNNVNEIKPNGDAVAKIVAPTLREVTFSFTTCCLFFGPFWECYKSSAGCWGLPMMQQTVQQMLRRIFQTHPVS